MSPIMILFLVASSNNHLPSGLLSSICFVESKHQVNAIHHDDGNGDSLGICQIKLNTARTLGFSGSERDLMVPATNIHYAAKYLRKQMTRYKDNTPVAVAAYNSGTFHPGPVFAKNQKYVDRVFAEWARHP